MNPEKLLHETTELLQAEAVKGPGTMFLLKDPTGFIVTRTPKPEQVKIIIVKYDCQTFTKGLTAPQFSSLMKKLWDNYTPPEKGVPNAPKH